MKSALRPLLLGLAAAGFGLWASRVTGAPGFQLVGLLVMVLMSLASIWRAVDPDRTPGSPLTAAEIATAERRLPWVRQTVDELALAASVSRLGRTEFATSGARYESVLHRIFFSRALCARLDDAALRLILAHEVGHAKRRWQCWIASHHEAWRLHEEVLADATALGITGATPQDWSNALAASARAEDAACDPNELAQRRAALGLSN
jgi:Zn-dependent protease with chaperone function